MHPLCFLHPRLISEYLPEPSQIEPEAILLYCTSHILSIPHEVLLLSVAWETFGR